MTEFTPYSALAGGALIGLSAVLLMWLNGRIAGVSGIVGGLMRFDKGEFGWRASFVLGLILTPIIYMRVTKEIIPLTPPEPVGIVILAGLLVGIGSQMGNGCVSGHGICGIARLSPRSIVATLTFILAGFVTVYVMRHVFGGGA